MVTANGPPSFQQAMKQQADAKQELMLQPLPNFRQKKEENNDDLEQEVSYSQYKEHQVCSPRGSAEPPTKL